MKVEIIDHISGNQEIETKSSGILVYDKDGNEYHIKRVNGVDWKFILQTINYQLNHVIVI